ncbi:MAG: TolB family protein [Candidatus Bipolaricaulaceae bacterium]
MWKTEYRRIKRIGGLIILCIEIIVLVGVSSQCLASSQGKIAFVVKYRDDPLDIQSDIWVMDADGSNPHPVTNDPFQDWYPCWSPDGTKIAFHSDRSGNVDIWVINADGSGARNLTNNPARDSYPAWSPDSRKIAFASIRYYNPEIYVMNADGSNQRNLTNHPARDEMPAWSPVLP